MATRLAIDPLGTCTGVGVAYGVIVAVITCVGVRVRVSVPVKVGVGVFVSVGVFVGVGVSVGVGVFVGVGVSVGVGVLVGCAKTLPDCMPKVTAPAKTSTATTLPMIGVLSCRERRLATKDEGRSRTARRQRLVVLNIIASSRQQAGQYNSALSKSTSGLPRRTRDFMNWVTVALALLGVAMVIVAQVLFKLAAAPFNDGTLPWLQRLFTGPMITALVLYVAATVLWLIVLGRSRLIAVYPIMASAYLLVPLLGWLMLGETPGSRVWIGAAIIFVGICIAAG